MVMTPEEQRMMGNAQASQPRSGLLGLFDKAMKTDDDTGLSPLQNFAAALDPLIMKDMRAGQNIRQQGAQRATSISKNKTVDMLRKQGRNDLADAVMNGTIAAKEAFSVMQGEKSADTAFQRQKDLAAYQAGLKAPAAPKSYEFQAVAQALMNANPNLSSEEALNMALSKGPAPQKAPTSVQEYQYAAANNQLPEGVSTFPEYERFMARAGRDVQDQTMHPTQNRVLSEAEIEQDKAWVKTSGIVNPGRLISAQRNSATILSVLDQMGEVKEGQELSGPLVGSLGAFGRNIFNPEAEDVINRVSSVIQQSLKDTLGAQFAKTEGEQLIARAYDPKAPPELNAARLRALFMELDAIANAKLALNNQFTKHGTVAGYDIGLGTPTAEDFYSAFGSVENQFGYKAPLNNGSDSSDFDENGNRIR